MTDGPVLVVGGTGALGGQVVDALLARGKQVRALVRPASDASRLETAGVTIARGDMLSPKSLLEAFDGVDAVVTTAAGYTRHSKGDSSDTDVIGNRNLADAAARTGVRRFVLTSILTCDRTPDVPHFWHKKLAEDRLEELGVPFVALRPGAFVDQVTQIGGDAFAKHRINWFGSDRTALTFVLTADLAQYLAAAVDADATAGERIDIGWDRPVGMGEIADIAGRLLGERIKVRSVPAGLLRAIGRLIGPVAPFAKDMAAMVDWFGTGKYVADTTRQRALFGAVPTAEDAVTRLLTGLGHTIR
ncbi:MULTISPECIES: SDR family oxidoreductase [Streptomyces]|uniref:SDR family oxidoreductase n=1 Tax=Streptomyces lycopersici TaxID=2974589 RepID=UPI0021D29391|nr:SDR family oxidoreductase [Streptomyces sp. NEAU-383]